MTGQRGASADTASIPGPRRPEPERPHFDMVLRGYDRIEVDEYIEQILEENAELRHELETAGSAHAAELERAPGQEEQAPPQYAAPQHYDVDTPAEDSFGFRAEKLLRLAEREAAEMRTRATRDAEGVEATARRRSEEQLRAAERESEEIRTQAAAEAGRLQKQVSQEAARVGQLHRTTKDEIRRLAGLLNAELERPDPEAATSPAGDGPTPESPGAAASNL